jgi:hypothetical protein
MAGIGHCRTLCCWLQAATCKLDEDRRQLQEWGERLVALTKEFDEARQEVKAARKEIEGQRTLLAQQASAPGLSLQAGLLQLGSNIINTSACITNNACRWL